MSRFLKHTLPLGAALMAVGVLAGRGAAQQSPTPAPTPTPVTAPTPTPLSLSLTQFAVFADEGVTLDGPATIKKGLIGSNGYVSLGPNTQCAGVAGRTLRFSSAGGATINGPITINDEIALGIGSKITGDINGGANIDISPQSQITGRLTAAQDIRLGMSGHITGDVRAGGSVFQEAFHTLTGNVLAKSGAQINGTVNGNVTCQALSVPFGGHVNGQAKQGTGDVVPLTYAPVALPTSDTISVNDHTITGESAPDAPVKPGHYGALVLSEGQKLYLTSGDYYFSRLVLPRSSSVHLVNVSDAKGLHVYVATDITVGIFVKTFVNGQASADTESSLAKKVLWEVGGNFEAAPDASGSGDFFGAVFAPKGSISIGDFEKFTGSLVSGRRITAGSGFTQIFVPSGRFALPAPVAPTPPATTTAGPSTPAPAAVTKGAVTP
ncbi:MAG: polymer-forming cytoskeletal protein [Armatimonadota bacterium]|nr:polymer-forming cytoskeletal protein [Armatimonadota bacterium]